ncbi:MAG: pyridoxal 5'-phosphate synthase glutaminase subunit PdxT [Actinomycetota bacterium]
MNARPVVGVLALQGAFAAHAERLATLGVDVVEVRRPVHLEGIDGIVLPGGESTAMSNLLKSSELVDDLGFRLRNGLPAFGTCAGMILLAEEILDGRDDQISLGVLPIAVRRNGYGRQIDSFECDLALADRSESFHAVFIRAPKIDRLEPDVEILATHDDVPVLVRRGATMASSFHPELTDDSRIHEIFLDIVEHHLSNIHTR